MSKIQRLKEKAIKSTRLGKLDELISMMESDKTSILMPGLYGEIFEEACRNNRLDIVKYFFPLLPPTLPKNSLSDYIRWVQPIQRGIFEALVNKKTDVINFFYTPGQPLKEFKLFLTQRQSVISTQTHLAQIEIIEKALAEKEQLIEHIDSSIISKIAGNLNSNKI